MGVRLAGASLISWKTLEDREEYEFTPNLSGLSFLPFAYLLHLLSTGLKSVTLS